MSVLINNIKILSDAEMVTPQSTSFASKNSEVLNAIFWIFRTYLLVLEV